MAVPLHLLCLVPAFASPLRSQLMFLPLTEASLGSPRLPLATCVPKTIVNPESSPGWLTVGLPSGEAWTLLRLQPLVQHLTHKRSRRHVFCNVHPWDFSVLHPSCR